MNNVYGTRERTPFRTPFNGLSKDIGYDSTSNINELFDKFDEKYFQDKMKKNGVLLEWSQNVNSDIAGYCYELSDKVKGSNRCYIVLNKPLLILRSRQDVIETLLHEMIHAVLKTEGVHEKNGGHGPKFLKIMKSINKIAGTNITVNHGFYDAGKHCDVLSDLVKDKTRPTPVRKVKDEPKRRLDDLMRPIARPRIRSTSDALFPPMFPSHPRFASPQPQRFPQACYQTCPRKMSSKIIMSEILDSYKGKLDDRNINLIGYDDTSSESDFSDSDPDSDFDYCNIWNRK